MKIKQLSNDQIGISFFAAAMIVGFIFRLLPPYTTDFPINDGALFLGMIETLKENGFSLPNFIGFNHLPIPFAYPPLAFYISGAVSVWFGVPSIDVMRWLPAIVLCLTLPVEFILALQITNSKLISGVAVFLYALTPRSLTWFIMGGGVTRSVGSFFLLIAVTQIFLMYTRGGYFYFFTSILFSGLVCYSHPEAAIHTILIAVLMWGCFDRSMKGAWKSLGVGLGTLVITAPWWAIVVSRFGLSPFISAGKTGFHSPMVVFKIMDNITGEPKVTFIITMAVLGFFLLLARKEYFLPSWCILGFLVEPRNAPNIVITPLCIMAAIFLLDVTLPALAAIGPNTAARAGESIRSPISKALFGYLICSLIFGMLIYESRLVKKQLTPDTRETYEWIRDNTSADSQFMVITGDVQIFDDYANEWFPLLTERRSLTTIQGYEWIRDADFEDQAKSIYDLQACAHSPNSLDCIETLAFENQLDFDHILVIKNGMSTGRLLAQLIQSNDYLPAHETADTMLFIRETKKRD